MSEFKLRGNAETDWFFSPNKTAEEYEEYATAFRDYDEKFTVQDFIALKNAQAKALISKAIFDLPENWFDDKGCFENHFQFMENAVCAITDISNSIDKIGEALENKE